MIVNWSDKYKPKNVSEMIGEKNYVIKLNKFIDQFTQNDTSKKNDTNKKNENTDKKGAIMPCMLVTGKNGIGKTSIVDLVLKEKGFEKITVNLSNIICIKTKKKNKTKKTETNKVAIGNNKTVNMVYSLISSRTKVIASDTNIDENMYCIPDDFNDESMQKTTVVKANVALVIDDISSITNRNEKDPIKGLIKLNNKLKQFPIIIIGSDKYNKLVNDVRKMVSYSTVVITQEQKIKKKISNEIKMFPPSGMDLERYIKSICLKEKLNLFNNKNEEDIYSEIIEYSQYDLRRLINCLEELKMIYYNSRVSNKEFDDYRNASKAKDIDPSIYEATCMLLNKYVGIETSLLLYSEERATIPLIVHENYPLNMKINYPSLSPLDQINMICKISKNISESDKIDGLIYSSQLWNLQPVHGFYSCVMPSYHINSVKGKLSINDINMYSFTKDYTKTSTRKINNKVIKKLKEKIYLKKMSINDFLHLTHILKYLLAEEKYSKLVRLIRPYGINTKELESIIKIDRISNKIALNSKTKTILKKRLDDI